MHLNVLYFSCFIRSSNTPNCSSHIFMQLTSSLELQQRQTKLTITAPTITTEQPPPASKRWKKLDSVELFEKIILIIWRKIMEINTALKFIKLQTNWIHISIMDPWQLPYVNTNLHFSQMVFFISLYFY